MGTRADFYVADQGRDLSWINWIGSVGQDGYPDGFPGMKEVVSVQGFRDFLYKSVGATKQWTAPSQGGAWPWENSQTTDYTYVFNPSEGDVQVACFGCGWAPFDCAYESARKGSEALLYEPLEVIQFPDMSKIANLALDERSGLIFMTGGPEIENDD